MAEVSRKLGVGLKHKLSPLKTCQCLSVTDRQSAGSVGVCVSRRTGQRADNDGEEKRAERLKLDELTVTQRHGTGTGLQCGPPSLPLFMGDFAFLDSNKAFIMDVFDQLLPVRSLDSNSSYRMACWVNKSVPLTPSTTRMQRSDYHRACYTLLLLSDKQSRHHPGVIITQTRSWSNNQDPDSPLYRSRTAYYDILQVSPNATQAQIKTAYYKQSFLYHPDKNAGSEEATQRFSQISEAYSILGSVGLRKKYDRGILSSADVHGAGRPSGKESSATARSAGPKQQGQQRSQPINTSMGGKPVFDFDAFYQAHYGEQLQREQALRYWRKHYKEQQQDRFKKWKLGKMMEMAVGVLLAMGGVLIFSLRS